MLTLRSGAHALIMLDADQQELGHDEDQDEVRASAVRYLNEAMEALRQVSPDESRQSSCIIACNALRIFSIYQL